MAKSSRSRSTSAAGCPRSTSSACPRQPVQEARERVRSAIRNSGYSFPIKRITVNLAPADLRKEGPAYDLPIAVGILIASGQVPDRSTGALFLGELSLDGALRHTQGVLPMVGLARERGFTRVYRPGARTRPKLRSWTASTSCRSSRSARLARHLRALDQIEPFVNKRRAARAGRRGARKATDFRTSAARSTSSARWRSRPPAGTTCSWSGRPAPARRCWRGRSPTILPPMTTDEALEVTQIYSVAGMLPADTPLIRQRPFRAPHHTISHAGLVGGGRQPRPGEITLSHRGVLFLDELPEFAHSVLESIRQPLEDRLVTVSRAQGNVTFPANFMLIAAMNPCPCGY